MKLIIVIGDGEAGNDFDLQAEEFISYGAELAKQGSVSVCHIFGLNSRLKLLQKKVSGFTKSATEKLEIIPYGTAEDLRKELSRYKGDPICLIIIGHGFPAMNEFTAIGAVEVCAGKNLSPEQRSIDSSDVNRIMPLVYIGLHCYAGYFVKPLDPKITTFDLTGDQPGQNTHINAFVEQEKFGEVMGNLIIGELRDAQTSLIEIAKNVARKKGEAVRKATQ